MSSATLRATEAQDGPGRTAARRVLRIEADALQALADGIDASFAGALDLLVAARGRVVVTGMGKSGHVASKIAATLASTGTPAQFVHPGEASHGDLGMIAPDDVLIALSNSGNTAELTDIINYSRRRQIPMIAITSKTDSSLAQAADIALILPSEPEACPMGLAPTTSTTMMLALGDAIAVALLERKGFRETDFQALHPGGSLGQKLLRVSDLMHDKDQLPLCGTDTVMSDAIIVMTHRQFGCVGVVDAQERLIGIITDGDLRRHMKESFLTLTAGAVMTQGPKTIGSSALAAEALGIMNANSITTLFVVQDQRPVGIVRMHDCLRAGL
ncbi:MAG: KpsF/GutQ family sugar-phosphate isomerase [Pseudomonadota bacterium]